MRVSWGEGLEVAPEILTGMAEAVAKGEGFDFVPANDWRDFLYQNWLLEHTSPKGGTLGFGHRIGLQDFRHGHYSWHL